MRVVVSGGRGFIGTVICRALRKAGHEVVALGRGELDRGEVLVCAAGAKHATLADNRAVHVIAALDVLAASRAKHVVYLSSGECYGDAPLPYREDGPTLGKTSYAQAKLEAEYVLSARVSTVILRLAVVYGPGQRPPMLLPSIVRALRDGEHVALTDGQQTRDFVYVDDVANAVLASISTKPTTINIGSGKEVCVRAVCEALACRLGRQHLLGFGERLRGEGDAWRYVLAIERARALLGWSPSTSLEDGLSRLVAGG